MPTPEQEGTDHQQRVLQGPVAPQIHSALLDFTPVTLSMVLHAQADARIQLQDVH